MSELSSDSEGAVSFQTESESEHESNWGEEKNSQKDVDYTATAKEIICENVNITTENALKLNSGYHNMLKVLKNKLEILLTQCQERQLEIDKQIDEYRNSKRPLAGKSRTSGYICGQPYFKDDDLYPGPHNDDYLYRKNVKKEFFPLDMFEVTDTNWTVKDKVNILKGVKMQIVEFIERENRLKIRKVGNGLVAEKLRREIASLGRKEIGDLWERVLNFSEEYPGQHFEIDWLRISNVNISERHSVSACIGIWNNYMLPGLVRDAWKADEEDRLVEAVQRHQCQDWSQIAAEVGGRSAYQCFVHYQTTFSDMAQIKHEKWTQEEDGMLIRLVEENRVGSNIVWNKVVEKMPLRNKIQCYNRYMFTLMRPSKNAKFTPEEDCVITAYVQEHGDDFKYFPANLLPGRTNRQIWARYNHTLKYVNKHAGWTIEEDIRLMNFIKENLTDEGPRKISWAACSKVLGNHSRLSCRTRYYTIEKFLEKNPDATLDDVPRKEKRLSTNVTNENWMQTMVEIRNEEKANENEDDQQPSTSSVAPPPAPKPKKTRARKKRLPKNNESKNRLFSDTLRCAMKKSFYEKLKYTFHYRFGDQFPDVENNRTFCNLQALCILLNCTNHYEMLTPVRQNFTLNELKCLRRSFAVLLNPALTNFLLNCTHCFLMPPNYNTILGMRGIVLHANYPQPVRKPPKKEPPEVIHQTDEIGYQNALQNFRSRFRAIFYWTMLLSSQNPREADFQNVESTHQNYTLMESASEHDYGQPQLEEQISLQQLVKLHHSPKAPQPVEPMPVEEPLPTDNRIKACVDSLRKVRISRGSGVTESVLVEELNDDSLDGMQSPPGQPCQVQFSIMPEQPSTAVAEYRLDDASNQLNLVTQITVINPGSLPIVVLPTPTETVQEQPQEEFDTTVEEDTVHYDAEDTFLSGSDVDERVQAIAEEQNSFSEQDVPGQDGQLDSDRPQEAFDTEPTEPTSTTFDDSAVEYPSEVAPAECGEKDNIGAENLTLSATSVAHVTAITNVGDFVIEELEEAICSETVVSQTTTCDEPLDLHLSPVPADHHGDESAMSFGDSEPDWQPELVRAPRKTYSRAGRSAVRLSDRQEEITKPVSHAWRWNHLDEQKEDDIDEHREWWERCDPVRNAFRVVQDDFAFGETDLAPQQRDEVIVIEDDVLEIKEEPVDIEEVNSYDNLIDVQLPQEENQVDESTIQQIIQTASNILRISETYKLDKPALQPPRPPPPPPPLPPVAQPAPVPTCESFRSTQSSSLVVQTPSRIFDEESNCYYYVDEVEEDMMTGMNAPVVEINTSDSPPPYNSQMVLENLLQHSLEATYPVMPQFATPQRVEEPFEEIPITRTPNRTQSTYGRRARSQMAMEETYSPLPPLSSSSINKPKRPPREPVVSNPAVQHTMQVRALSQLGALSRQPRMPQQRPASALSMDQPTTSRSWFEQPAQKRPHSAQQMLPPAKRTRPQNTPLCAEATIKQEPDLLANAEEVFSAVDIIDALNSMNQRMKQEHHSDGETPEDDKSSLKQLVGERPVPPTPARPESRSAMQKTIKTIIESSAGRPRMNVHFKVAGVTIKKVQQK